jgi:hypothetical protein
MNCIDNYQEILPDQNSISLVLRIQILTENFKEYIKII